MVACPVSVCVPFLNIDRGNTTPAKIAALTFCGHCCSANSAPVAALARPEPIAASPRSRWTATSGSTTYPRGLRQAATPAIANHMPHTFKEQTLVPLRLLSMHFPEEPLHQLRPCPLRVNSLHRASLAGARHQSPEKARSGRLHMCSARCRRRNLLRAPYPSMCPWHSALRQSAKLRDLEVVAVQRQAAAQDQVGKRSRLML